jgi:3-phenylpropionate/trans-cinnamate dioxygenase ferredoxin subunit
MIKDFTVSENSYQRVASTTQIPRGKTLVVTVEDSEVLICHTTEGYFAVDNLCSHADASLGEGKLKGQRIICPLHGAAFDVRDGSALSKPAKLPLCSHALKVEGENIWVALKA